jgi:hypothetical protein
MRKRKTIDMFEVWDVFGNFCGWAWKSNSPYTSYLFYVEPKGNA